MSALQLLIGVILPPITVAVLVAGLIARLRKWSRAPVGKITLYPSAKTGSEVWSHTAKEVFLFRSLWSGDRPLWVGAWIFHASLALIFVGHFRVVTDFPRLWAAFGMGSQDVDVMSAAVGGAVGVVILAIGLYLLVRRFTSRSARDASKTEDYVALVLLLAVIITGDAMRFLTHFDLAEVRAYFQGLFTLNLQVLPQSNLFWVHFLLVQILFMYIPFGKLLHLPGVLFSHPLLRRD
ncbi:MAG: respiratory nitrate reductase subunit gamma [Acidobacteriota bacterium]